METKFTLSKRVIAEIQEEISREITEREKNLLFYVKRVYEKDKNEFERIISNDNAEIILKRLVAHFYM